MVYLEFCTGLGVLYPHDISKGGCGDEGSVWGWGAPLTGEGSQWESHVGQGQILEIQIVM